MSILAFDTHKFIKELTGAGMKAEQAEVLASSYVSLFTDQIATKADLKALEDRLNARIACAQVVAVLALGAVIVIAGLFGS